jgi:alcohol dehydrogenase
LVQVDELARLAQTVEELAEILLHRGSRMTSAPWRRAAAKQQGPPAVNVGHRSPGGWQSVAQAVSVWRQNALKGGRIEENSHVTKTMKALVLRRHGDLQDLEVATDYPVPQAIDGHVVIRVKASSFNYHDVFTMRGMPGIKVPLPVIIGLDMAGEIVEVGAGVAPWKVGDRVLVNPLNKKKGLMGEMLDGGMAEYCLVAADQLVAMPDGVSFAEAASLPVAYGTAHRMLITHNTIRKGDRVLVLGASGGVGTGCVILAKLLGAEVIACASSEDKLRRLKEMGADEAINYKAVDFSKWAVEKYGKPQRRSYEGGVDVVINFTGGDTWVPSLRCIKRGGKLLVCGATAGHDPKEDLRYIWTFEINIVGSNSFYDDDLKGLMQLIQEGKMRPVIDKVLPLEQAAEGLRMIRDREVVGKVVVAP